MAYPFLTIRLDKIEHNARTIVALCGDHGIEVAGVTKVVCGHPKVAKAMLDGGVTALADSRFENIQRLRRGTFGAPLILLRLPPLSGVDEAVESVEFSLNSETAVLQALSASATKHDIKHAVILMVDLGDLREGVWPDQLIPLVRQVMDLPGIRIAGIGTNLACFGGVVPSAGIMQHLVDLAVEVERQYDIELRWISGVNSSGLELIASGLMPRRVNHARIGEAILLGRETIHRRPWPETYQDAFCLHAEVLEVKRKPSVPVGERSEDAFGHQQSFRERGDILRALVNVGREDVDLKGIKPIDSRLQILGASSGYLVLDITATEGSIRVGDELTFSLNYSALLRTMTSMYIKKKSVYGIE